MNLHACDDCPKCGEPTPGWFGEPGEHDLECRQCGHVWSVPVLTPRDAVVIRDGEAIEYDAQGRGKRITGRDTADADRLFKKRRRPGKVKPVGRQRERGVR